MDSQSLCQSLNFSVGYLSEFYIEGCVILYIGLNFKFCSLTLHVPWSLKWLFFIVYGHVVCSKIMSSIRQHNTVNQSKLKVINRAAMGRARFMVYPWFFNHAAMGRARFMVYPWFFFFRLLCKQTQASTRPNFESRNLWCLLAKSCWNINKSHLSREKIKNPALAKNYIFSPEI